MNNRFLLQKAGSYSNFNTENVFTNPYSEVGSDLFNQRASLGVMVFWVRSRGDSGAHSDVFSVRTK